MLELGTLISFVGKWVGKLIGKEADKRLDKARVSQSNKDLLNQYKARIIKECSTISIYRPSPTSIEKGFVEPKIIKTSALVASSLISPDAHKLVFTSDTISTDTLNKELSKAARMAASELQKIYTENRIEVSNLLGSPKSYIILGAAGAGKSTLISYIAYKNISLFPNRIPILVNSEKMRTADIKASIDEIGKELNLHNSLLDEGGSRLIIYVDGLDELPRTKMKKICDEIRTLASGYENLIINVSCREAAYDNELSTFISLTVLPFDKSQMRNFIMKWPFNDGVLSKNLRQELENNIRLFAFASQPILLVLLCSSYGRYKTVEKRLAAIYDQCLESLLWSWDADRSIPSRELFEGFDLLKRRWMHEFLAFRVHSTGERYIDARTLESYVIEYAKKTGITDLDGKSILANISAQNGLLEKVSDNVYCFRHLGIQEFLAGCWISQESRWQEFITAEMIKDHWWREVFAFCAGKSSDATDFFCAIRDTDDVPSIERYALLSHCLRTDPILDIEVRRKVISVILSWYHDGDQQYFEAAKKMIVGIEDAWTRPVIQKSIAGDLPLY